MNKFAIVIAAAASLFTSASFAQGYVGGSLGLSDLDLDCTGATSCDSSDTGIKLFGGFMLGNGFSIEGTYIDFGKAKGSDGFVNVELTGHTIGIGGAYTYNFSPAWSGTGRLGLASNRTKVNVSVPGSSGSAEESNTTAYYGLSIGYKLTQNLSIHAAADFTRFEFRDEKSDARLLSIGATYSF